MMEGLEVVETRLASSGFSHGQGLHSLGWRGRSRASLSSWYQTGGWGRVSVLSTLWPASIPGFRRVPPTPSHSAIPAASCPAPSGRGGLRRKLWSAPPQHKGKRGWKVGLRAGVSVGGRW